MAGDLITLAVAIGRVARGLATTPLRAEARVLQWIAGGELCHAQLDPIYPQGHRAVPKGGRIGVYDPDPNIGPQVWVDEDGLDRLIAAATVKPLTRQDWLQEAVKHPPFQGQAITAAVIRGMWAAMKEAHARGEVEGVYKTPESLETQLRNKGLLVGARRKK